MNRSIFSTLLVVFSLFITSTAFGEATFNGYEWGTTKSEMMKIVEKDHTIAQDQTLEGGVEAVTFRHELLGENPYVIMYFTPEEKKLFHLVVYDDDEYLGSNIRSVLVDKYGKPDIDDGHIDEYVWLENGITITLDCAYETSLHYYHNALAKESEKQSNENLNKAASNTF